MWASRTIPRIDKPADETMTLRDAFQAELERTYQEAGERTGYWGKRFIQKVRRTGGVATAKDMLKPRTTAQRK